MTSTLTTLGIILTLSQAKAELPTARELIRQAEDACTAWEARFGQKTHWLESVAEARAYVGDHEAALRIAKTVPGILRGRALRSCWTIHFELTGKIEDALAGLVSNEEPPFWHDGTRLEIARVLAKNGRMTEAKKLAPRAEEYLESFHLTLAEEFARRGEKQEAIANLELVLAISKRRENIGRLREVMKLWLQLGNRERAVATKEVAAKILKDGLKEEDPDILGWGVLATMETALGTDTAARAAFAQAQKLADVAAKNVKKDDFQISAHARTLGGIGARQFAAGFKADAAKSFARAAVAVKEIRDESERRSGLRFLVETQSKEGDIEGALKNLGAANTDRDRAHAYCRIVKVAPEGTRARLLELVQEAAKIADAQQDVYESIYLLTSVAEAAAKLGERPLVRRCLDKALEVSRANQPTLHHAFIAHSQIRIGLLDEAYATIQGIPQPLGVEHAQPLCELAYAAAKKEASRGRK